MVAVAAARVPDAPAECHVMDELTSLLHRAADGDDLALARLVSATQHDVWRLCAWLVDRQSADDLAQEVYLRALRSAHRFRGDASARTWLSTIARRVAADEIRVRQRRRRAENAIPPRTSTGEATDASDLRAVIAMLDEDRRVAFVATQLLGYTYAETAQMCGVPVGTIRSRVARAREQLVGLLDDVDDDTA